MRYNHSDGKCGYDFLRWLNIEKGMDGNLCYIGSECLRKEIISYKCLIVMSEKKLKVKSWGEMKK